MNLDFKDACELFLHDIDFGKAPKIPIHTALEILKATKDCTKPIETVIKPGLMKRLPGRNMISFQLHYTQQNYKSDYNKPNR